MKHLIYYGEPIKCFTVIHCPYLCCYLPILLLLPLCHFLPFWNSGKHLFFSVFQKHLSLHIFVKILTKSHTIYSKHKSSKHPRCLPIHCSFILGLNYVHSHHFPSADHSCQIIYKKDEGFFVFLFIHQCCIPAHREFICLVHHVVVMGGKYCSYHCSVGDAFHFLTSLLYIIS